MAYSLLQPNVAPDNAELGQPNLRIPDGPTLADGLAYAGRAIGGGLQDLGQGMAVRQARLDALARQGKEAAQRRYITERTTEYLVAQQEALAASKDSDSVDASSAIVDEHFQPRFDQLDEIDDPDVRATLKAHLTERYYSTLNTANGRAEQIGVAKLGSAISEQDNTLLAGVSNGSIPLAEAMNQHQQMTSLHERELGPDHVQRINAGFENAAAKAEYFRLLPLDPHAAKDFLKTDFAVKAIDPAQVESMMTHADQVTERQNAAGILGIQQTAAQNLNSMLVTDTIPPTWQQVDETATLAAEGMSLLSKDPVTGETQITVDAARLQLLAPQLRAKAEMGDTDGVNLIAKAMPKTAEAETAVANARQMLQTTAKIRAGADEYESAKQRAIGAAVMQMNSAATSGGAPLIDDVTVQLSDGKTKTIQREELVSTATAIGMQQIASKSQNEGEFIIKGTDFLSNNGTTFKPWERLMNGGWLASAASLTSIKPGDEAPKPPAALAAGYDLYRRIGAVNPRIRDEHLKDAQAKRFYETAEFIESTITPGKPNDALAMTMQGFARIGKFGDPSNSDLNRKAVADAVDTVTTYDTWLPFDETHGNNQFEMKKKVERLAQAYLMVGGGDPGAAVEKAAAVISRSHRIINDWAVDVGSSNVPENIDSLSRLAIDKYVNEHPDEQVEPDELTMFPDGPNMVIALKMTGQPVEDFRASGIYSRNDLIQLGEKNRDRLASIAANTKSTTMLQKIGNAFGGIFTIGPSQSDANDQVWRTRYQNGGY